MIFLCISLLRNAHNWANCLVDKCLLLNDGLHNNATVIRNTTFKTATQTICHKQKVHFFSMELRAVLHLLRNSSVLACKNLLTLTKRICSAKIDFEIAKMV